jgi:hypothetical protein
MLVTALGGLDGPRRRRVRQAVSLAASLTVSSLDPRRPVGDA